MSDLSKEALFLRGVTLEAGKLLMSYYGSIEEWQVKSGRADIVTAADHAAEELVLRRLQEELPGHNLLSEECGWVKSDPDKPTWVLDPLDGTRNFAFKIPTFSVSLACTVDGAPVLGAIYDPVHEELFFASRGGGATMNDTPIHVSAAPDLTDALISVSWSPRRTDKARYLNAVAKINEHTTWFRRIGSAAIVMAYVASGRFDGYVQGGINAWDIAAGMLLIQEAGGIVTGFDGRPIDLFGPDINVLAGNPEVHQQLLPILQGD